MKIQEWQSAPQVPFNLDGRVMFSESGIELIHLKLSPGEALEMHKNPFDVVFYILKGEGVLECEGIIETYKPFVSIGVKSTEMRAWRNESNSDFEVLVVKIL